MNNNPLIQIRYRLENDLDRLDLEMGTATERITDYTACCKAWFTLFTIVGSVTLFYVGLVRKDISMIAGSGVPFVFSLLEIYCFCKRRPQDEDS